MTVALTPDASVSLVETVDDVLDLREWLGERREFLGIDIETTGLNLGRDRVRLCQLGDLRRGFALAWEDWKGVVKDLLPQYQAPIAFHNAAFDLGFLKRDGVHVPQRYVHDTMVMAHLLEPRQTIGLKPVAARYLGRQAWAGKNALSAAFHGSRGKWNWATIPIDHPAYYAYSTLDTMLTAALAEELFPKVIEPYSEIYEIEMGCIFVLRDARLRGVRVDLDYVRSTRAKLIAEMAACAARLPFEPSKDKQLYAWFTKRGQEEGYGTTLESWWPWRTESDAVSFDEDALTWAKPRFPEIVPPLLTWRKDAKVVNSYLDNILSMNVDGILRCNIKTLGARTARMSITEPALQTLPRGRVVRDAFIPSEGNKLVLADYEQAEARVFASYAGCQPMIDTLARGEDLHRWTASHVYHDGDLSLVTKGERQISKNVGYAKLYGAGAAKIALTASDPARGVHVTVGEVEAFLNKYNQLFPEIEGYQRALNEKIMRRLYDEGDGYVVTVLGRRLPVDKDKLYKGMNYLVQSSATADILKLKLIELAEAGLGDWIRLPVHDEVVSDVPDECVEDALHVLNEVMPDHKHFACPLTIDTDVVERWGEHYEEDPTKRYHWNDAPQSGASEDRRPA